MSEAIERVFKKEIEEAAEKEKEMTIANMLKDNVKATTIAKWTGASLEKIVAVASQIGISTLSL